MVDRLSDFAKYCTDEQYESFMGDDDIFAMPGVAMLVDDGVTRGPMGPLMARAITLEDVQAMYHRLPTTYRPASLLPVSVSHE